MRSDNSEKMVLVAGIAVLSISLAVPAFQKLAEMHEVRDVASRVADVPRRLMASGKPGKTLSVQVQNLVDGLSPDSALAETAGGDNAPAATPLMSEKEQEGDKPAEGELKVVVGWSGADRAEPQVRENAQARTWTFQSQPRP